MQDEAVAETDEELDAFKQRNECRDALKRAFASVRIICLPLPHVEIGYGFMSLTETSLEFQV
jgi:hypothetical protein